MIEPYYQSERVKLFCGDCLSILPTLSGVDAVVTDPPYGISHSSNSRADRREGEAGMTTKEAIAEFVKLEAEGKIKDIAIVATLTNGNIEHERANCNAGQLLEAALVLQNEAAKLLRLADY